MPTHERPDHSRLSGRDREILRDVICAYILSGDPVSSRTVSKLEQYSLSSATIRNVMADLEEMGYLSQPHTSAGRVPTAVGYHFYIETLMRQRTLPARERRYIDSHLRECGGDAEERVAVASQLLSELSRQVGVVLLPALDETVLRSVEFVPLSGRKVLCVIVAASGFVDSKIVELPAPVAREELVRAGNYLTEEYSGLTLREIRARLVARMDVERVEVDELLRLVVALARQGLQGRDARELRLDGAPALLASPELADPERLRRLFDAFNDKVRLVQLLDQCLSGPGVRTWIGDDSALTGELDLSLVAKSYQVGERVLGSVGILGPSRMEYEKIIPLVEYLAATLGEALERALEA